MDIQAKIFLEI